MSEMLDAYSKKNCFARFELIFELTISKLPVGAEANSHRAPLRVSTLRQTGRVLHVLASAHNAGGVGT